MGHRNPWSCALARLTFALIMSCAVAASAAPEKAAPKPDFGRQIEALAQTQAALQQQITELREAINGVGDKLRGVGDSLAEQRESLVGVEKANKTSDDELAELVRGLYVEVSGVKGDVGLVRQDVQTLNDSVESSRLGSGILIAAVIGLQIILVLLVIRSRR